MNIVMTLYYHYDYRHHHRQDAGREACGRQPAAPLRAPQARLLLAALVSILIITIPVLVAAQGD